MQIMNEQQKLRPEVFDEAVDLSQLSAEELREIEQADADSKAGRVIEHADMVKYIRALAERVARKHAKK
jgi:cobalamin biosynthesis protein CbiD